MSRLLHIGLFTEGTTDVRFLESVVLFRDELAIKMIFSA